MFYQASSLLSIFSQLVLPFLPNCSRYVSQFNRHVSSYPAPRSNSYRLRKRGRIIFTPGVPGMPPPTSSLPVCPLVAAMRSTQVYATIYIYIYIYIYIKTNLSFLREISCRRRKDWNTCWVQVYELIKT